jgi:hypothetical protein
VPILAAAGRDRPSAGDYMVTRLMALASNLRCGTPVPAEPTDALAAADEQRQQAEAVALGQLSVVQRQDARGDWQFFGDQNGEVQTVLDQPAGVAAAAVDNRTGQQRWTWTASFEAFDAGPRADVPGGQVPDGSYRFVVDGAIHQAGTATPYHLTSAAFTVGPWTGLAGHDLTTAPDGSVSFTTDPVVYPRSYRSPIRFVHDDLGGIDAGAKDTNTSILCKTCTFRPWASGGEIVSATVTVLDSSGAPVRTVLATRTATGWSAATGLRPGESAVVAPGGLRDAFGETNGVAIAPSSSQHR